MHFFQVELIVSLKTLEKNISIIIRSYENDSRLLE